MVKKLIKYDFASYLRLLLPVQFILLGIAGLNRFIQLFEDTGSAAYTIIFRSSLFLYILSAVVCLVLTGIVSIVRFYQGLYTNEGYLSHTLPVTASQHILSKLLVSLLFHIGSVIAIILSFCIATLGELNIELFKAGGYLLGRFYSLYHVHAILYILEILVLILVGTVSGLLLLYFCISVGQLAKKRKILLAFGVFFGVYLIGQVIGTILLVIHMTNPWLMNHLAEWAAYHMTESYHIFLCGGIVYFCVLGTVFFLITRRLMSRRLNLT